MARINYVTHDGKTYAVDADDGISIMEAAQNNGVPGILADCGGCMSCATCHVYIDPEWLDTVGKAESDEEAMLEAAIDPRENSRLSCQVKASATLDGLIVHIPKTQI